MLAKPTPAKHVGMTAGKLLPESGEIFLHVITTDLMKISAVFFMPSVFYFKIFTWFVCTIAYSIVHYMIDISLVMSK